MTNLSSKDIIRFKNLVNKKTGILFPENRLRELESGLKEVGPLFSCRNADQLYSLVCSSTSGGKEAFSRLISGLGIGESYFFRNKAHFDALRRFILPELIERHKKDKILRLWSAGCSTGEEPYSLAILLREMIPDIGSWSINILASDINDSALEKAREGKHNRWSFREVPLDIIRKNFIQDKEEYAIKERVKGMVTLKLLNLKENSYPSYLNNTHDLDLILCRNVFIYFNQKSIREIGEKFHQCLAEGGYLLVGHSEYSRETYRRFVLRAFPEAIFYQKIKKAKERPKIFPAISHPKFRGNGFKEGRAAREGPEKEEKRKKKNKETEVFQKAVEFFEKKEYRPAMKNFFSVLETNPKNARALFIMGRISADQGNISEAVIWCEKTLKEEPLFFEAYFLLALLRLEEENLEEAVNLLKKVIYIEPEFLPGYSYLENIYQKQGKPESARKMQENVDQLRVKA